MYEIEYGLSKTDNIEEKAEKVDKAEKAEQKKTDGLTEKLNELITADKKSPILKRDDCQELRNLEYKNMLMYGNNIKPKESAITHADIIDDFLKKETAQNKLEQWAKLDKTGKISKLRTYGESLRQKHVLTNAETSKLNTYLLFCLERKYFTKVKDVNYDREKGVLIDIPNLCFNEETRVFAYKKSDKSNTSSLKSLAPKKNNRTHKY